MVRASRTVKNPPLYCCEKVRPLPANRRTTLWFQFAINGKPVNMLWRMYFLRISRLGPGG